MNTGNEHESPAGEPLSPYKETTADNVARTGCGVLVGILAAMSAVAHFWVRDGWLLASIVIAFGVLAWFGRDCFWKYLLRIVRFLS